MSEKQRESGFIPTLVADDLTVRVDYRENGELLGSKVFNVGDLEGSPIYNHWLCQSLFTTLSARCSQYKGTEKLEQMALTFDLWCEGEWAPERKGGVRTVKVEIEAIANLKGCSVEQARAAWNKLTEAQQKALTAGKAMQDEVQRIQKSREAEAPDLTDLLG